MERKKKILLYWFEMPGRPELMDIFVYDDPCLEFVHLYHFSPRERTDKYSPYRMLYWFDYNSPYTLLNEVQPDLVVVANGEGLYEVALLMAANQKGIKTLCVQHGLFAPSVFEEMRTTKTKRELNKAFYYWKVFRFYAAVFLRLKQGMRKQLLKFLRDFIKHGQYVACEKNQFPLRLPTNYVCFTRYNAQYFITRDGSIEHKIIEIGVPFFDYIFRLNNTQPVQAANAAQPYLLFIDTRLIKDGFPVPAGVMNGYYSKLNQFAQQRGYRLKIKLHPWSYNEKELLEHPNIEYIRNISKEQLVQEIVQAKTVFSFFSTLLFPIFFLHEKVVGVEYGDFHFPAEIKQHHQIPTVNLIDDIPQEFTLDNVQISQDLLEDVRKKYLFKTDGKAKERLKAIIAS